MAYKYVGALLVSTLVFLYGSLFSTEIEPTYNSYSLISETEIVQKYKYQKSSFEEIRCGIYDHYTREFEQIKSAVQTSCKEEYFLKEGDFCIACLLKTTGVNCYPCGGYVCSSGNGPSRERNPN